MSRKLIQIRPTNIGDNKWSFLKGTPQIQMDIAPAPHILNGKSLRLNGVLNVWVDDAETQHTLNNDGGTARHLSLDARTGVQSLFENIQVNSATTGRNFEMVKHYNRLAGSLMSKSLGFDDYVNGGVDVMTGASCNDELTGQLVNKRIDFSMPILCGMLQNDIDLMMVGGLQIIFDLALDQFTLHSNNFNNSLDTTSTGHIVLSDLVLTYDAIVPPQNQASALGQGKGGWTYPSYSSYYTSIVSNDSNHLFNLNTGMTKSVLMNFVPSEWLNNIKRNSNLLMPLTNYDGAKFTQRAKVKEVTFLKNNIKAPLDFAIPCKNLRPISNATANAQLLYEDLNTLVLIGDNKSNLLSNRTALNWANQRGTANYFKSDVELASNEPVYNIGVNYDHITEQGVSFKNQPFGFRLRTDLTTGADHPFSAYIFVKQLNTIQFQNGLAQVTN